MPVKIIEIPDIHTTIQKNIQDSVTRNLLRYLGLEDGDVIYDTTINREVAQPDSTIGMQRGLSYGNTDKVVVEYEERRDEMNRIERAPMSHNEVPFFYDRAYGIELTPSAVRYDATVTIRRRGPSRAIVSNWCNAIQRILDQDRAVMLTQADYHYVIPAPCLNLLAACYRAKEKNRPSGQELSQYLKTHFSSAVTVISNMAGNGTEFALRETATRIVGVVTGDGPQETRDDNLVSWVGEYQYRFSYTRPEAVVMRYPAVLNNTMLPATWWEVEGQPGLSDETDGHKSVIVAAGDYITKFHYITLPIYVPRLDYPDLPLPSEGGYVPIIVGQIVFDPSEVKKPAHLFDLDDIPGVIFDEETLEYIRDSYCRDPHGNCSVIKIIVYEDGIPLDNELIGVNCEDLSVWMDKLPDLSKNYQFTVALQTDWTNLSDCQYDELRKHPGFVDSVIDTFFPYLRPAIKPVPGPTYPTGDLDKVIDEIWQGGIGGTGPGGSNGGVIAPGGIKPPRPNHGPWGRSIRIMITVMNSRLITYMEP